MASWNRDVAGRFVENLYGSRYHKEIQRAIQQLENLLSKSPDNARALMLLALTHERMSEFAKAKDAYEKLLAITSESVPALNNLAYLYAERLGELDKALELAQKVRALQPGNPP